MSTAIVEATPDTGSENDWGAGACDTMGRCGWGSNPFDDEAGDGCETFAETPPAEPAPSPNADASTAIVDEPRSSSS
jgi:hypothetical protein